MTGIGLILWAHLQMAWVVPAPWTSEPFYLPATENVFRLVIESTDGAWRACRQQLQLDGGWRTEYCTDWRGPVLQQQVAQ